MQNPGYYDIIADNLGIWHVPNKTPLSLWKNTSILRYRTKNGILSNHGGNLLHLYTVNSQTELSIVLYKFYMVGFGI